MSKKKADRSIIKKKRKERRKQRRMARRGDAQTNNVLIPLNNKQQQQDEVNESKHVESKLQIDQQPSTSRDCQNIKYRISPTKNINKKRSPWRNAGGKVNKFKKVIDNQARKLIKRSVYLKKDSEKTRNIKRYFNKSKTSKKLNAKRKNKDITGVTTLEEGEIRTDEESFTIINSKNYKDDDDDCVLVEPNVDEIIIEDENDNDITSGSKVLSNYQSLVHSFKERVSSTPYRKSYTNASSIENSETDAKSPSRILPYFVDICGRRSGLETINSTDAFADYSKLSTLEDNSVFKHRKIRLQDKSCSEIIDLDNSEDKEQPESCEEDDSVIFVSERNKNDFIPIVDDTIPPNKILKISETHNTSVNRQRKIVSSLFTLSEKKKLNEYNENAYNPSGDKTLTNSKRMVIIDGSNVAFKHGLDQAFSVKGLKIAIEYFEKMGHEVKAVIPQFRMNKSKSSDPEELERLHKTGKIVQTPCKNLPGLTSTSYDDRFILQLAFELDAAIVSNDNYRDLLHENPAFKKIVENRVIGYTWCNDIFILPKDPYGKWGPTLHKILNR